MGLEDDIIPVIADIDGAIAELAGKIKAHAAETFQQLPDVPASAGYLVAWNQFVFDFETWRLGWWIDRFKRRNEVLAFRKRFNTLQEYFRGLAGTTTAALTTPKFKAAEITGPTFGVPSWALPVALGFGGLVLLSQLGALAPALASLKGLTAARANPRRRRPRRSPADIGQAVEGMRRGRAWKKARTYQLTRREMENLIAHHGSLDANTMLRAMGLRVPARIYNGRTRNGRRRRNPTTWTRW